MYALLVCRALLKFVCGSVAFIVPLLYLFTAHSNINPRLPPPDSSLPWPIGHDLRSIGLGLGYQIYKCSKNGVKEPSLQGSYGLLYDLGRTLHKGDVSEWELSFFQTLSGDILSMASNPALLEGYLKLHGYNQVLGECRRKGVDMFYCTFRGIPKYHIYGNVSATMMAPASSYRGTKNEGAVPWLYLQTGSTDHTHDGISAIYQYYTAGGESVFNCSSKDEIFEVPYAAQYWIYEKHNPRKQRTIDGVWQNRD